MHSELLQETTLRDFFELWPEKFLNVTNGVTPRRFMVLSDPRLSRLIGERIGDSWIQDLEQLRKLEPFAEYANLLCYDIFGAEVLRRLEDSEGPLAIRGQLPITPARLNPGSTAR